MNIFGIFKQNKSSAKLAKERLQHVVRSQNSFISRCLLNIQNIQHEIATVLNKYTQVDVPDEQINLKLSENYEEAILECNVVLPDLRRS